MGDKIGISVQSLARFLAGICIAFVYGWELALVILGYRVGNILIPTKIWLFV